MIRKSLLILLALASVAWGTVRTAASVEYAACSTVVAQSSDGDTVHIPSGAATWKSALTYTGKGVFIRGAGSASTIITDSVASGGLITITGVAGSPWTLRGIGFIHGPSHTVTVKGTCKTWVIDSCSFTNYRELTEAKGIWVGSSDCADSIATYGLISDCQFKNCGFISVVGCGNMEWKRPLGLGTFNSTYIENCAFLYDSGWGGQVFDATYGGRFVLRYSTVTNAQIECHSLQSNDTATSRAARSVEIYRNKLIKTNPGSENAGSAMFLRAGSGVVFNDSVVDVGSPTHTWNNAIYLDNVRSNDGNCDGTENIDGNTSPADSGWPCRDQIGRSSDIAGDGQDSVPLYAWGVYKNGTSAPITTNTLHIKANRDYINGVKPGYYAYTYPHPLSGKSKAMQVSSLSGSTIRGSGFLAAKGNGYVKVGTTTATTTSWANGEVVFTNPGVSGKLYIVNNDFQVDSSKTYSTTSRQFKATIAR